MSALVRRARGLDARWVDALAAAALAVVGGVELLVRAHPDHPAASLAVLTFAYSILAFRRRRPLAAGAAMLGAWVTMNVLLDGVSPLNVPLFAVLAMAWSMGRHAERREALASLPVLVAGMTLVVATMAEQVPTDYVFPAAFAVIAWVAGRGVRTRSQLTEELHEAAVRAQEAHERELAAAAAEERRRIARELHDIVAHSVSVMVVQAGGARRILDRDPARAVEAAARIEDTGRAALVEMRRLLGMLGRHDDSRAPQPTLASLDALVHRARAAGQPVELTVDGDPVAVPPGLDLAAYRVVQEGLTNALRHAEGTPTQVTVRWHRSELELAVADRGPGPAFGRDGGHGIAGMQERVRLYGGELWTGRRSGGGWEIRARIPLEAPEAPAA